MFVMYCVQGQVLVKNEFIGVNFIDTYFRSGLYPRPSYPSGLGEEGAGTVEAVGPGEAGQEQDSWR
jgi:NADPH2:quinone reductase